MTELNQRRGSTITYKCKINTKEYAGRLIYILVLDKYEKNEPNEAENNKLMAS